MKTRYESKSQVLFQHLQSSFSQEKLSLITLYYTLPSQHNSQKYSYFPEKSADARKNLAQSQDGRYTNCSRDEVWPDNPALKNVIIKWFHQWSHYIHWEYYLVWRTKLAPVWKCIQYNNYKISIHSEIYKHMKTECSKTNICSHRYLQNLL